MFYGVLWGRWVVTYRNVLAQWQYYKWLTVIVHNVIQFFGVDSKCCQSQYRFLAVDLMWKSSAGRTKRWWVSVDQVANEKDGGWMTKNVPSVVVEVITSRSVSNRKCLDEGVHLMTENSQTYIVHQSDVILGITSLLFINHMQNVPSTRSIIT